MGGGDLNSKKSWHPNTLKNQERVWKAEQSTADEKKRIAELQKERAMERDREELNALANHNRMTPSSESEVRLNWMYDKPDKKIQAEDYLLGKSVDSKFDGPSPREEGIPTVSRRVAGVSMVGGPADGQVDLVRKLREDPLLLVQERERAARAALLNNPIQRKKLTELLRQDQEKKKEKSSKSKDIDNLLASKLNALGGQNGVDLASLLASGDSSDDSSSDSSSGKKKKKKKKKKKSKDKKDKKSKRSKRDDSSDSTEKVTKHQSDRYTDKKHKSIENKETDYVKKRYRNNSKDKDGQKIANYRKHRSPELSEARRRSPSPRYRRRKSRSPANRREEKLPRKRRSPDTRKAPDRNQRDEPVRKKTRMSSEERAARLAEMVRAGAANEAVRGERVAAQRDEPETAARGVRPAHAHGRMLPTSLEARIQSNRHNIQRNKTHMNEHFARR